MEEGQYDCGVTEGTLAVHYQFKNALINLPNKQIVHITLYIPSGMFFENIVLDAGAGEVKMEEVPLSCQKFNVQIGAGKWKAAKKAEGGDWRRKSKDEGDHSRQPQRRLRCGRECLSGPRQWRPQGKLWRGEL